MEAAALNVVRSSAAPSKPMIGLGRSSILAPNGPALVRFASSFQLSGKLYGPVSIPQQGHKRLVVGSRRGLVVKASSLSPESSGSNTKIAPLQLESPIGQFLSQILISHPHLLPAAVEQQLEQLQTDRDAEKQNVEEPSATGTDLVLYRRIAEVKANERRKALEEILYALVVQKFMDANVSLIPSITPDSSGQVDSWPSEDGKFERFHSPEAYEMIRNHLALILGNRIDDPGAVAQISKLRVGQVYAASVMYGYFLKRVDQRFQLEKTMKILPTTAEGNGEQQVVVEDRRPSNGEDLSQAMPHPGVSTWAAGDVSSERFCYAIKPSRLRTYVMSFDGETLQRYATIRSKEAVSMIEKHTEALFGRPEIVITPEGAIDSSKDENINISFGGLKTLVLEAVTFGSFLWDVESFVDSRYHFVLN